MRLTTVDDEFDPGDVGRIEGQKATAGANSDGSPNRFIGLLSVNWALSCAALSGASLSNGKVKLANLRLRPQTAVTFRNGGKWATVEGRAELAGPDDPQPWLDDDEALRMLLRDVFTAAGGTHEDWATFDRVMAEQRRAAVLITPTRVYSN